LSKASTPLIVRRYGKLLRARRRESRVTVEQLCERSGIPRSTLFQIETGQTVPNLVHMQAIARILGNDMGWLPPIVAVTRQEAQQ
jgi:transcriptional regulator with XRE-family HTH domain